MRVAFKNMINGYTGKADDSIIYYIRRTNSFYIKKRPHITHGANQDDFQAIMQNLRRLQPDFYYKEDFSFYLELYNQLPQNKYTPCNRWNNLWMKAMFGMVKLLPEIDLKTITKQDIHDQDLPCLSLKQAVDAGLLPKVKGYERFDNEI